MPNSEMQRRSFIQAATASAITPLVLGATPAPQNLVANGTMNGRSGALPDGWKAVTPNPAIAPEFKAASGPNGRSSLAASSKGRAECFGYAAYPVKLEEGKYYRMEVVLRTEGIDDVNLHLRHGVFARSFNDGIFEYRREGKQIIGVGKFAGPKKATDAEVRLYFRFAAKGRVYWDEVRLEEAEPDPPRLVKIASRQGDLPKGAGLAYWDTWLSEAARRGVDIALLPEMFNGKSPTAPETLHGESGQVLAAGAKRGKMHTCASFYERRGDLVYNTASLYGRTGQIIGTYEKFYPYDPELDEGVTPGTEFPVFETDIGKVAIMICYDSWFPEITRMLALRGAEVILFPNAGYYEELMTARAADNGVAIVSSSLNNSAAIWDSSGARAGETNPHETRSVWSVLSGYEYDTKSGMVMATVDLSRRPSPAWWGGPMLSAPGGRRVRRTGLRAPEENLLRETSRWWTGPAHQGVRTSAAD